MNSPIPRRTFLAQGLMLTAAVLGARSLSPAQPASAVPAPPAPLPPEPFRGAQLDGALVKEFVVAGHTNIPKVKEMLAAHPTLINATWDWGSGDFESALNGASHLGRREVALYLLDSGARLDAPCAAMLGETEIIAALLRLSPAAANTRGAHGFSLLHHAAYSGQVAIAELLAPHLATRASDCNEALQPACMSGHTEFVAWLLQHGVDNPNTKNFQGKTPLDLALQGQHADIAQLLRDAGGVTTR